MWKLSPEALREQPHIETVEAWCKPLFDDAATWRYSAKRLRHRKSRRGAAEAGAQDGSVARLHDHAAADGATMLTFQDITDTENVETCAARAQRGA